MGKSKGKAKVMKVIDPRRAPPSKTFNCPFCNHEKSVTSKLDKAKRVGTLKCGVCGVQFQCIITSLSAPIDVYGKWIDECETMNNDGDDAAAASDSDADSEVSDL